MFDFLFVLYGRACVSCVVLLLIAGFACFVYVTEYCVLSVFMIGVTLFALMVSFVYRFC